MQYLFAEFRKKELSAHRLLRRKAKEENPLPRPSFFTPRPFPALPCPSLLPPCPFPTPSLPRLGPSNFAGRRTSPLFPILQGGLSHSCHSAKGAPTFIPQWGLPRSCHSARRAPAVPNSARRTPDVPVPQRGLPCSFHSARRVLAPFPFRRGGSRSFHSARRVPALFPPCKKSPCRSFGRRKFPSSPVQPPFPRPPAAGTERKDTHALKKAKSAQKAGQTTICFT